MKKSVIDKICESLNKGEAIREKWSDLDRLVMEKQLPYLCLYRYPEQPDEAFIKIIKTQPSYLIVSQEKDVRDMLFCIAETVSSNMNAFMLFELWPGHANSKTFKIYCKNEKAPATITSLKNSLDVFGETSKTTVKIIQDEQGSPPDLDPVAKSLDEALQIGFLPIALEIPPLHRKQDTEVPSDVYFRGIRSILADTVKKAAFEFMRIQTPYKFNSHLMLGKTRINQAAIEIDRHLADLSNRINFLLLVSPINTERQWTIFKRKKCKELPHFSYRLITLDPEKEKRELYSLRISKVNDPALAFILREKRLELDKQLTMMEERGGTGFKYLSQSLYPAPEDSLVKNARKILRDLDARSRSGGKKIDCHEFASMAKKELKNFHSKFEDVELSVEIRQDITSLLVSKDKLLIGEHVRISPKRAEALIQHEVGTHMLTYCNGKRQMLGQLASGLAGYDDLQEGLAVLAEYLVGGLTPGRLRTLSARVLAVDALVKGADFIEIFKLLTNKCELSKRRAFFITSRVMRGGGLTKDAVYLAGLIKLLEYLQDGGDLEVLFTGKFSFRHIPLIEELMEREVLKKPQLPTYFKNEDFMPRLNKLRLETEITDLLN